MATLKHIVNSKNPHVAPHQVWHFGQNDYKVIVNGVGVYTTVGKYAGLFMNGSIVNATLMALLEIQKYRDNGDPALGVCARFFGVDIQVDLL